MMTPVRIVEMADVSRGMVYSYCMHLYGHIRTADLDPVRREYLVGLLKYVAEKWPGRGRGNGNRDKKISAYNKFRTETQPAQPAQPATYTCPFISKLIQEKDDEILRLKKRVENLSLENSALLQDGQKVLELKKLLKAL